MNVTTNIPQLSAVGTNNNIGLEWGTTNPVLTILNSVYENNEMSYFIPRLNGIKPPAITFSYIQASLLSLGYWSGVLALNGKIYCVPHSETQVLEIDPINKTTFKFGSLSSTSSKWCGGVLAQNGMIYCMPRLASGILEINPYSRTTKVIGTTSFQYNGAVLANNGNIYGMPYTTTSGDVLEFNPFTYEINTFGNVGTNMFNGGVLAPNENIYAIPYSSNNFAIINPNNKTVKVIPCDNMGGSNSKCSGGVLAPNGKIYCAPYNATKILVIDTLSNDSYTFGSFSTSTGKWAGGSLAPDGYIYFICADAQNSTTALKQILRLNWHTETTEIIEIPNNIIPAATGNAFTGLVLTPNGQLIAIPYNYDGILEINFGYKVNFNTCLSNIVNTY